MGGHTKTEGLATDISADAREYETQRAGIATSSEEEEEDLGPEAPVVEAPPLTSDDAAGRLVGGDAA